MGNILGAPESLFPVRRVRGGGPPVSPYTPGVSGCSLLRDKQTQPPPSDWFPGTSSLGWTQHSTQNTSPFPEEPHELSGAPPQKGPRGLSGPDGTQAGRQGKGGGNGRRGSLGRGTLGLREACVGTLAASHRLEGSSLTGPTSPLCPSLPPSLFLSPCPSLLFSLTLSTPPSLA